MVSSSRSRIVAAAWLAGWPAVMTASTLLEYSPGRRPTARSASVSVDAVAGSMPGAAASRRAAVRAAPG